VPGFLVAAIGARMAIGSQNHPADNRADDLCPICMAVRRDGTALAPTPPALPIEFAGVAIDRTINPPSSFPRRVRGLSIAADHRFPDIAASVSLVRALRRAGVMN